MVCHKNFILDEGKLKSCPEVRMSNKKEADYKVIRRFLTCDKRTLRTTKMDPVTFEETEIIKENPEYREPSERYINFKKKFYDEKFTSVLKQEHTYGFDGWHQQDKHIISVNWGWQKMFDYLGIIPFVPSVMINISPDWSGFDLDNCQSVKIKNLSKIIEGYLGEGERYTKASYVIENGSSGKFIHAHVVAEMNPKLIKSVNTHLAKGNHTQQLIKQSKKVKGMEGTIKGVSVHKVFLRTEELVSDKLDYLEESKKPEGHKNHSVIFKKRELVF